MSAVLLSLYRLIESFRFTHLPILNSNLSYFRTGDDGGNGGSGAPPGTSGRKGRDGSNGLSGIRGIVRFVAL